MDDSSGRFARAWRLNDVANTGKNMRKPASLFLLSALMAITSAIAQDWKQKPFTTWNTKDVTKVLTDSPWVTLAQILTDWSFRGYVKATYYRIRLLTAAPIRMAYLRYATFVQDRREMTIDYKDLVEEGTPNRAASLYERFVRANPDDIRLKGSEDYIILSITLTVYDPDWRGSRSVWPPEFEYAGADLLGDLQLSDLADCTFLSTSSSQKVCLVRYERSSYDRLGAKFYFPRRLSPDKDWVNPRDKELIFSTRINGKNITAKFDLRKLTYNGKLEF